MTSKSMRSIARWMAFLFACQLSAHTHIVGHWIAATAIGVPARLHMGAGKAIPGYGAFVDKFQPHDYFMCAYDSAALSRTPGWQRVLVGFSGPLAQLVHYLFLGLLFPFVPRALFGGYRNFAIVMLVYSHVFLIWTAVWFFDDPTGDFALLTAAGLDRVVAHADRQCVTSDDDRGVS